MSMVLVSFLPLLLFDFRSTRLIILLFFNFIQLFSRCICAHSIHLNTRKASTHLRLLVFPISPLTSLTFELWKQTLLTSHSPLPFLLDLFSTPLDVCAPTTTSTTDRHPLSQRSSPAVLSILLLRLLFDLVPL